MRTNRRLLVCLMMLSIRPVVWSQALPLAAAPVVVTGTVPDEATRHAIIERLRAVYGVNGVVDQLRMGTVTVEADWTGRVLKLISPQLQLVSHGRLTVTGGRVELKGEVETEDKRRLVNVEFAKSDDPGHPVTTNLTLASRGQAELTDLLSRRIVEFEAGSSVLLPRGRSVLDSAFDLLSNRVPEKVLVIGHTDATGSQLSNVSLSLARANAVRNYLVGKGLDPSLIATSGMGSDRPIDTSETAEGRARNRRIEMLLE